MHSTRTPFVWLSTVSRATRIHTPNYRAEGQQRQPHPIKAGAATNQGHLVGETAHKIIPKKREEHLHLTKTGTRAWTRICPAEMAA